MYYGCTLLGALAVSPRLRQNHGDYRVLRGSFYLWDLRGVRRGYESLDSGVPGINEES